MTNQEEIKLTLNMDENELYLYLLDEIYDNLNKHLFGNSEIKIEKPDVVIKRIKTTWFNFRTICLKLKIDENHVSNFFIKEYTTSLSINQEGHLILNGKYSDIIICSTLKKYIKTFLQCATCKTLNTGIVRKSNKLTYLICNNEKCKTEKVIKYIL
jgi:translation initiation factor 2 subunit 2